MAEQFTSPAAALWFVDPWHRAEQRWFDGARWTPHVTSRGTPGFDPLVAAPVAAERRSTRSWVRAIAVLAGMVAVAGLVLWIATSLGSGAACAFRGRRDRGAETGMRVGLLMMILAPLIGWVMVPVAINWLRTKPVLAVALLGLSVSVSVLAIAAVDTVTSCA